MSGANNNNIDFYIAHTPEIQIYALYNINMQRKNIYIKTITCNIILNLKSTCYRYKCVYISDCVVNNLYSDARL